MGWVRGVVDLLSIATRIWIVHTWCAIGYVGVLMNVEMTGCGERGKNYVHAFLALLLEPSIASLVAKSRTLEIWHGCKPPLHNYM
jgi:hypothetical protein